MGLFSHKKRLGYKDPTGQKWFIVFILVFLGCVGAIVAFQMGVLEKVRPKLKKPEETFFALKAENTLLKAMLGQVEASVVVLAPADVAPEASGKLVWDVSLQRGFIYARNIPLPNQEGEYYNLWVENGGEGWVLVCSLTQAADGHVQQMFKTPKAVFKAKSFEVRRHTESPEREAGELVLLGSEG
jgi:hypothetical protein